ncbi:glycosyltransferase family 2 protein [Bizionia argentinensis JUB59]|uniref:Glycosyltransferase family 2 protein n=1 Tax=Bizionia argentinensis JUB59 TaxID=1046627 RepID=G2EES7_9FLAO|nr:glycosyltransferase family 2 protein [Bizionia argentinensis]EGV43077.1 glycosyltransferase family 2 protein [Bizionia argentinensis JUB59]
MTNNNDIAILIVTHNHVEYIDKLIDSLIKFNLFNTFICDALSTDGTLEKLKNSPFKDNLLIKNELEGFSKNNNDLIRHFDIKAKYYLLLNPDTFFDVNFVDVLYNRMKLDSNIGVITPILKYPDGRLQITWKTFPNFFTVVKKRFGILKSINEIQMKGPEIDWCLGACMLISSNLLKKEGVLLDERYRLYCEDIDICFEAHQKNMKVIGEDSTYVYHNLNEKSSNNILSKYNIWNITSIFKFIFKWNIKYFRRGL